MKKFKLLLSWLILISILSSCSLLPSSPDFWNNTNKPQNNNDWELSINIDEIDGIALEKELWEREKVIQSIQYKQEYLQTVTNQLEQNIDNYFKFISNTKGLIVVDLKIIKSVQEWLIDETNINKDNYIYLYIKALNENERKYITSELDYWIGLFSDDEEILDSYITHLDKNNSTFISKETTFVYNIINYYVKKWKYKKNISANLKQIIENMNNLNINTYEIELSNNLFKRWLTIEIHKENINKILSYLLN